MIKSLKIVFWGNHLYGHHALHAMLENGFTPKLVIANIPHTRELVWYPSVSELAAARGLPVVKVNKVAGRQDIHEQIGPLKPDLFVVASFRNILDLSLLKMPSRGAINLHMAPLPKYRGAHPENWAIINGERSMGFSVHYLAEELDAGDIIAQGSISILSEDDILSLTFKLAEAGSTLLVNVLRQLDQGTAPRVPQDETKATYYPPRKPKDGWIDWSQTAEQIHNLVRALTRPYPGAMTCLKEERMSVWRTRILPQSSKGKPGEILDVSDDELLVATGDLPILIVDFVWQGEPPLLDLRGSVLKGCL